MTKLQESVTAKRSRKHVRRQKTDQNAQSKDQPKVRRSNRHRQPSCLPNNGTSGKKDRTEKAEEELRHVDTFPSKGPKRVQPEERTSPLRTVCPQKRPRLVKQTTKSPQQGQLRKRRQEEQPLPRDQTFKRRRILPLTRDTAEEKEKSHPGYISESSYVSEWVGNLPESFPPDNMLWHRLAEEKSSSSRRRKRSDSPSSVASVTPSDQKSRDAKSAAYAHKGYQMLLRTVGVLLESELAISQDSDTFCQSLLKTECRIPEDTLLRDDIYRDTIADLQERNESRVIQDVGRLFVPSVQALAKISEKRFRVFVESVNEAWDCCYPLIDPRPQPDYAVGFGRSGLSEARIHKLQPLIQDDPRFRSDFMSTYYMYFPFFSTEVKCGTSGLVIADRQNGHTMGVSVRGIVSLHRLAGKESQLHNKPVAFSVSHDHRMVRLTGWGPVIDGDFYTVHPLTIHSFDVTALKGLERWTPRKFTFGVYKYGLTLLDKIKAIIDELPPDLNLEKVRPLKLSLNTGVELRPPNCAGLSQQLDAPSLSEDRGILDSRHSGVNSQVSTPPTSTHKENPSKRRKV
ncbi:hypothetical protein PRK78_005648 [Emydomyces testavorans]|uniref:DUF7924 domain-containing protein n=1 Tax=Emydomyces testavorans TaxID=2070801 RepID=A0AAF0IK89_9EURO|nr:hypothetical protein PRK78_005648 [Emydomyces testavorans]